jgi:hypothetical protein
MYNILNTEHALIKENIWCTRIEVTLKLKDIQAASVAAFHHYVIKCVSDLRQVGDFHRVPRLVKALDLSSNGRMPSYFKYL